MLPDDVLPEPVPPGVESLPVELVPGVAEESVPLELVPGDPDLDLEDELSLVPLLPEPAPVEPVPELPLPVPLLPDCANAPVAPASASAPASIIVYLIFIGPLSSLASAPLRSASAPTVEPQLGADAAGCPSSHLEIGRAHV